MKKPEPVDSDMTNCATEYVGPVWLTIWNEMKMTSYSKPIDNENG